MYKKPLGSVSEQEHCQQGEQTGCDTSARAWHGILSGRACRTPGSYSGHPAESRSAPTTTDKTATQTKLRWEHAATPVPGFRECNALELVSTAAIITPVRGRRISLLSDRALGGGDE